MPRLDDLPRAATLPVTLALRAASLGLSVARSVARLSTGGDRRPSRRPEPDVPARAPEPARRAKATMRRASTPVPPVAPAAPEPDPPDPEPPAPAHVDREAVLVAEVADAEAAEGVGAQVHVAEPWENYSKLTAGEVIDRLATADAGSLAAVRLYEASHRRRSTVIAAADRRLAEASR